MWIKVVTQFFSIMVSSMVVSACSLLWFDVLVQNQKEAAHESG